MRIGVDSYAYHRLLGEVRPGEQRPPRPQFARGQLDAIAHARSLGVEVISLETNVLPPAAAVDWSAYAAEAGPGIELTLAHGHPEGIAFGALPVQALELRSWLERAPTLGVRLVRCVAGGPHCRAHIDADRRVAGTVAVLRPIAARAETLGLRLALENHADLTLDEVEAVLEEVGPPLEVCFDTSNWVRVGDDPVAAAQRLAGRVAIVHLKDHRRQPGGDPPTGPVSVAYGDGEVDLAAVLDAILAADGEVPICVELAQLDDGVDELALIEACVGWLRAEDVRRG